MSFSVSRTFKKYMPYENTSAPVVTPQTNGENEEKSTTPATPANPALPQQAMNPGTQNRGQSGNRVSTNSRNVSDMY